MNIRIGTRSSKLALAQSEEVKNIISHAYPEHSFTLCPILTKGDRNQHIALDKMKDKGIFVKEIEEQLLNGQIDIAVHSMKDMPSELPEGLCFSKTLLREDARDVLVLLSGKSIQDLPYQARIGTGSKRRKYQMLAIRPDVEIIGIRGNLDTRLKKMKELHLDGIIVAAAGLHRLHIKEYERIYLSEEQMLPALGQGAIAIEISVDRVDLIHMINALCNEQIEEEIQVERDFLKRMHAGCHTPIGGRCHIKKNKVVFSALYGMEDGSNIQRVTFEEDRSDKDTIAQKAVLALQKKVLGEHL